MKRQSFPRIHQVRRTHGGMVLSAVAAMLLSLFVLSRDAGAISPDRASLSSSLPVNGVAREDRHRTSGELSVGKFLVASRRIRDPRFMEAVILLTQHDGHGTVGLIINRPTKLRLSDVFPEIGERPGQEHYVFIGGPVGIDRMQMLIYLRSKPSASQRIFDNVYVSSSKTLLNNLVKDPKPGGPFRLYAGYAGWIPGQLEREVSRGDWRVMQADAEAIFNKEPSEVWSDLIRRGEIIRIKL